MTRSEKVGKRLRKWRLVTQGSSDWQYTFWRWSFSTDRQSRNCRERTRWRLFPELRWPRPESGTEAGNWHPLDSALPMSWFLRCSHFPSRIILSSYLPLNQWWTASRISFVFSPEMIYVLRFHILSIDSRPMHLYRLNCRVEAVQYVVSVLTPLS